MSNQFQYVPGKAALNDVTHSTGSAVANITDLVREINIHSSVNIKSTIVEFSIIDSIGYISKAPIQAGDVIAFTIKTADGDFERKVKVMEINSILDLDGRNLSYIIKCSSDLRYASSNVKLSKAYSGLASEIAYVILNETAKAEVGVWESSRDQHHFIAPNWDPIKCIKFLAGESVSVNYPERMMFFQDAALKWHFTSLSHINELYSQKGDMITYTYGKNTQSLKTPGGNVPNTESVATAILNVSYLNSFNIEDSIKRGNIKNTHYSYDVNTGKLTIDINSQWDTYLQNNSNELPLYNLEDMGQGNVTIDYLSVYSTEINPMPKPGVSDEYSYDRSQEIEIEVLGNHISNIGQMINIEIISRQPGNGGQSELDKRWSGVYSITAKRDVHTKDTHKMVLRCTKNSIGKTI